MRTGPRVVVVDGAPLVRLAVCGELRRAGVDVVGDFGDVETAVASLAELAPDVVLIDVDLDPRMVAVRAMVDTHLGLAVVVLSPDGSRRAALAAVRAGACGFVAKDIAPASLPAIVRGAAAGEAAVSRRLMRLLLAELRDGDVAFAGDGRPLSRREREVLSMLDEGANDAEVAGALGISEITVRRHVTNAIRKLGARDRADGQRRLAAWQGSSRADHRVA